MDTQRRHLALLLGFIGLETHAYAVGLTVSRLRSWDRRLLLVVDGVSGDFLRLNLCFGGDGAGFASGGTDDRPGAEKPCRPLDGELHV